MHDVKTVSPLVVVHDDGRVDDTGDDDDGVVQAAHIISDDKAVIPKSVLEVKSPTEQEVRDHELAHLPYRSWCTHCVNGKALERASTSDGHQAGCIPCVCADYIFMGQQDVLGTTPFW